MKKLLGLTLASGAMLTGCLGNTEAIKVETPEQSESSFTLANEALATTTSYTITGTDTTTYKEGGQTEVSTYAGVTKVSGNVYYDKFTNDDFGDSYTQESYFDKTESIMYIKDDYDTNWYKYSDSEFFGGFDLMESFQLGDDIANINGTFSTTSEENGKKNIFVDLSELFADEQGDMALDADMIITMNCVIDTATNLFDSVSLEMSYGDDDYSFSAEVDLTFSDYGTTVVTIPDSVIDTAINYDWDTATDHYGTDLTAKITDYETVLGRELTDDERYAIETHVYLEYEYAHTINVTDYNTAEDYEAAITAATEDFIWDRVTRLDIRNYYTLETLVEATRT